MIFTAFLEEIGVTLEAGQRAFCRVAFDGVQVADLTGEDRAWAVKIFGDLPRMSDEEWAFTLMVICVVAGGRSGKTYLSSLRLLHLALTVPLNLAPGEQAFAVVIAPRLEEAGQSLRYIAGAARKHPQIKRCIVSDTTEALVIRRPQDGQTVAITPQAAGAGGIGGRGKTLVAVLMDETCFFRDRSTGVVNDDAIFDAAEPRVIEGGQTIVASTPWVARGLLHRKWKENHGHPKTALSAHASTRNMRTNKLQLRKVDNAYKKDASNAAIEFGAEWGSTTTELFFSDAELDSIFAPDALPMGTKPRPGDRIGFGGDLGFKRNSSTLAGILERGRVMHLVHLEERIPQDGKRLRPSEVCKDFAKIIGKLGGVGIVADQHERASLEEHMSDAELVVFDAPAATDALVALRVKVRDGLVRCTHDERLRNQLSALKVRRTIGDSLIVVIPTAIDGSHCDLAQALANAVWGFGAVGAGVAAEEQRATSMDGREEERLARWAEERQQAREDAMAGAWEDDCGYS